MDIFDAHMHSTHGTDFSHRPSGYYLSCAGGPKDWEPLLQESRRNIRVFLGIHPMTIPGDPSLVPPLLEELDTLIRSAPRAGIGECGLDRRCYKQIPRSLQEEVLRFQIRLAARCSRPVSLHQVKAAGALAEVLEAEKPDVPFLIHGFKEKPETTRRLLNRGAYLSLGPGKHWEESSFRSLVRSLPRDRILLESDWPYADPPYEATMNKLYAAAAGVLGIDREGLLDIVNTNGTFFKN